VLFIEDNYDLKRKKKPEKKTNKPNKTAKTNGTDKKRGTKETEGKKQWQKLKGEGKKRENEGQKWTGDKDLRTKTKFIAMSAFHHARYIFGIHVLVLVPFINRHSIEQNMHTHRGWQPSIAEPAPVLSVRWTSRNTRVFGVVLFLESICGCQGCWIKTVSLQ